MTETETRDTCLTQKHQCPCGDDQCYIDEEAYEDDDLTEQFGPAEPSFLPGIPQTFGTAKVVPPPYVGQSFQNDDEALEYYSNFARNSGFLVRRERSKGNPEHPLGVYKRELVCHRAGPPLPVKSGEENASKRLRKKKPSRCRCDAQMVIKKNVTAGAAHWVVVNFSNVHNHELLDRNNLHFSPGYRYISAVDRERILALAKGGCNVNLILRALEMDKGVKPGELTFTEKDVKNFLQASVSINPENEGSELLKSCKFMKEKNPDFRYEFTSVEANKLEHIAWSYVDFHIGLKDAVVSELPHTKHAFSLWHIMSKLPSWFSVLLDAQYEKFKAEFCRVRDLETREEFEHEWDQMVTEYGLNSDRHISLLFVHRSYWAVSYLRSWFFGGLLATGDLSVKSFFRGFVNSQTRLKDFVEQKEIMTSTQYAVFETSRDAYLVRHHLSSDGGHTVSCSPSNEEVSCSCKGFECNGILCRHVLRVLSLKNCFLVPEKYLLHRWRRESSLFPKSSGYNYRTQALRSLASIIIQESSITKDRFEYVQWHLSRLLNHIRDMPAADEATLDLELSSSFDATVDVVPARTVTRGRPRKLKGSTKAAKEMQAM
ncbi:hypothetical protein BHE74_00016801 [Ensete ventricosum]|nr:hypothetical protein BHE74_00016801 [Ensete ventricosum]